MFLFFFKLKVSSNNSGEFMNVFLCITPYFANSAFSSPGISLNTLFCSPYFKFVWKPTILNKFPSLLSCLNWITAYGLFPVRKSVKPTGFSGPNLNVSIPLFAITSIGIQPSNISRFSNSCNSTTSALTNSSQNFSYSSLFIGRFI